MDADELSPPSAKRARLASCGVNDLSDADLAEIFKRLPPYDRLLISEVCRRWYDIRKKAWTETTGLDISPIPGESLNAVIKQCPNLDAISASRKTFPFKELLLLLTLRLSSIRFYFCSSRFRLTNSALPDFFSGVLFGTLPNAVWEELVLHDFDVRAHLDGSDEEFQIYGRLPLSLKHLQVSGIRGRDRQFLPDHVTSQRDYFAWGGLGRLLNLTCLILTSAPDDLWFWDAPQCDALRDLKELRNLVELCVACPGLEISVRAISSLTKLQVLCLPTVSEVSEGGLTKTVQHPSLRILLLAGVFHFYRPIPTRQRYPNGFGSEPLPLLHLFLGSGALENIRFEESPSSAIQVHPITAPLTEFLEKEEIAPIFEGVWIATQIKEGAKHNAQLWQYRTAS